jgi:prepilin-type N-terminal cleavage/methylation domain-containing protein
VFEVRWRRGGFTLIELLVVIAIMAGVIAMAAPRLLPALLYSTHEGAARRLANYGAAAIAEAALGGATLTFKFDFKTQEYWVETIPEPPAEEDVLDTAFGDETKDKNGFPKDDAEFQRIAQEELGKEVRGGKRPEAGLKVLDEQARRMAGASAKRARGVLGARAARVKQDENALPRSQQKESMELSTLEKKTEPVEVRGTLLGRTRLPEEVTLVLASVGGQDMDKGVAEVEITPAGLEVEAKFWLMNTEGRAFVVTWDPTTGQTGFAQDASK